MSDMMPHRRFTSLSAAAALVGLLIAGCGTRVERATSLRSAAPAANEGTSSGDGTAAAVDNAGGMSPPGAAEGGGPRSGAIGGDGAPTAGRSTRNGTGPHAGSSRAPDRGLGGSPNGASAARAPTAPGEGPATPPNPGQGGGDPATTGSPVAPGGSGPGSPVTIGSVLPRSGPIGQAAGPGLEALQTWSRMANERGGVNGHRVNLIVGDDGGDPARHRAIVQEFVERRGVIAFVQNFESLGGAGSIEYLVSKRIPVIGSIMGSQYFYEHPTYFPQGSSGDMFFAAYAASIAEQAKGEGKRKVGIMACAEVADCETGADLTERYAKEFGLEVVYRAAASIVAPDYTAQCLNARNAGVQILLPIFTPDGASRIAASCARQGYRPSYGLTTQTFGPLQITDPNMQDSIIFSPVFTWVADPPTPAIAEFKAAMARYLPGVQIKGVHAVGWTSAKLFERAAAKLPEPPTNEALLTGLYAITNDDLGGLTQPLTFSRDKPAAQVACWFTTLIRNGKLVPVNGGRRNCR